MKQKKYTFLFLLTVAGLTACSDVSEDQQTSISGEIVNPQSPYITISKDGKVLDTADLDAQNHFHYTFETVKPGFYTFRHAIQNHYETQMFYIESGDSLQLRLNTRDFDRSLMYSAEGAVANNFLMDLFLDYRKNNKILPHYYRMQPQEFEHKIDSIRDTNLKQLKQLNREQDFSSDYRKLAKTVIDYSHFDFKERYYFLVNKYNQKLKKELPDDFLGYRDQIDFNNKNLQSYYIYHYLLDDFLENKSIDHCLTKENSGNCFDLENTSNLDYRLRLADSLFQLKTLRTRFLTRFAARRIVHSRTVKGVDSTVEVLEKTDYDQAKLKQIKTLAGIQKRHFIGKIGALSLLLPSGDSVKISSILTKPTVFYYWSVYYKAHHQDLHQTIRKLRQRYPQLDFIGINIDNDNPKAWRSGLENFNYSQTDEYQLICPPDQQIMYQNYLNKLVFVNKEGLIIDSDLNVQDRRLEEEILGLINR